MLANVKGKYPRVETSSSFWATTRASKKRDFKDAIAVRKGIDVGVYETLKKTYPKFWSRHFYNQNCKSDYTTNNMTGYFNGWLRDERKAFLIHILELIGKKMKSRCIIDEERQQHKRLE